jgi:putative nucleotidyltransferase with HDIG domain
VRRDFFETTYDLLENLAGGNVGVARWAMPVLLEAMDRRDAHTGEHSRSVARLSQLVGLEMGLSIREMGTLLVGALLHDVGKIFVPNAILKKPSSLTPKEREIIALHPVAGSRALERIGVPPASLAAVKHHHERYDGSGYPHGLRGEGTPLAARIVQVADAFDSMTQSRSYRWGIPPTEALEEIERNAGTQFDPWVVRAFVASITDP